MGRAPASTGAQAWQSWLALTAATWHDQDADQPVLRSLDAYDYRPGPSELTIYRPGPLELTI